MTTKHTPGPWIIKTALNGDKGIVAPGIGILAKCFVAIRNMDEVSPEVDANAQLIADAPELLDVCRELLGPMIVWSQYWASTYNRGVMSPAHEEIIQRASVVIARNTPNEDNE